MMLMNYLGDRRSLSDGCANDPGCNAWFQDFVRDVMNTVPNPDIAPSEGTNPELRKLMFESPGVRSALGEEWQFAPWFYEGRVPCTTCGMTPDGVFALVQESIDAGIPLIASIKPDCIGGNWNHAVLVHGYESDRVLVLDPYTSAGNAPRCDEARMETYDKQRFFELCEKAGCSRGCVTIDRLCAAAPAAVPLMKLHPLEDRVEAGDSRRFVISVPAGRDYEIRLVPPTPSLALRAKRTDCTASETNFTWEDALRTGTLPIPYATTTDNVYVVVTNESVATTAFRIIAVPAQQHFPDVAPDHSERPHIEALAARGIVEGYPDGTYRPADTVSRGEFLKMALEAADRDVVVPSLATFVDVPIGHDFHVYVETALAARVVDGSRDARGNRIFMPNAPISRFEAAKIVVGAFQIPLAGDATRDWPDLHRADPAYRVFAALASTNGRSPAGAGLEPVLRGDQGGLMRPWSDLRRSEAAKIVYLAMNRDASVP